MSGIRVVGESRGEGRTNEITIGGLSRNELESLKGALLGQWWMTRNGDGLTFMPAREPLPKPAEDEDMLPFWRQAHPSEMVRQEEFFDFGEECDLSHRSPSIFIQHLCGYNYTPENYKYTAAYLESLGFTCLRSRRGANARYREIWYLPGLWAAEGELEKFIGEEDITSDDIDKVVRFLCKETSFGTLDVSVQRAAMTLENLAPPTRRYHGVQ